MSAAQTFSFASTGIVAAVLGLAVIVVWLTLTRAALNDAQVGLERSVRQMVTLSTNNFRTTQIRYGRVAEDSSIRAALIDPSSRNVDAARGALTKLGIRPDSGLPIELWNPAGARMASVGTDSVASVHLDIPVEATDIPTIHGRGLDSLRLVDTAQLSELERVGNRSLYWLVMPVRDHGRLLGFVASRRHVATAPQAEATIRELSGNSARGYYRNANGTTWTSIGGSPQSPPDGLESKEGHTERVRKGVGRLLFAEGQIPGTPLFIGMEAPRSAIMAVPNATARQLSVVGVLMMLVAALLAWIVGRRVMRPLNDLADAADSVARGDYSARVPAAGTHEVVRLASSFNRMARQIGEDRQLLQTANRAKSDFLASMSHELRTPLNAIGGYTELMEMGVRGPITEEQRRDLGRIRASQAHLLGLIGSLLDLSRIESGQVTYTMGNVALDPLLLGLEALVLPQATTKKQVLVYEAGDPDLAVYADREKVRQVMLNLLSNAVRYSPAGASITMSAHRNGDATVAIEVRDTGPGIPLDRQRVIFEPFVQLDRSLARTNEGVGLGLSISRDLAHGMKGDLTVTSAPGAGSCFRLILPAGVITAATPLARTGAHAMPAVPEPPHFDN